MLFSSRQFSNARTHVLQIFRTRKKGKIMKEIKQKNAKETQDLILLVVVLVVSTVGGVGKSPLPSPWENLTDDVSLGGSVGALVSSRGGGWEIKDAKCRKMEEA